TNHSYFNLSGHEDIAPVLGHELTIEASAYTPANESLIPTGRVTPVEGTPFDFREAKPIGEDIRDGSDKQVRIAQGFDHNFVLDGDAGGEPRLAARVHDPVSGRTMEVLSDQPGIQFYSGNFIDATMSGKGETLYRQSDALCLEPQVFPDAPNQDGFPSARLEPGDTYRNVMVLRFTAEAGQ
ncbi:galactose mutarotase-like enzyme, partial [Parvularcula dongshanensis]